MKRILVVDDDPTTLTLVEKVLSREGHEVRVAADGSTAKELMRTEAFNLILLDIMMPEIDGFEVSRAFREESGNRKIPVVFITSRKDGEAVKEGFRSGGTMILNKPFSAVQLVKIVNLMMR